MATEWIGRLCTTQSRRDALAALTTERDNLFDKLGETMARANQLELERDAARAALAASRATRAGGGAFP